MYRNIYYSQRDSVCHLFTWDKDVNRVIKKTPYHPYFYIETNAETADALSIFNTKL